MAKATTTKPTPTTVTAAHVKRELGRVRNNRARRKADEPTVASSSPGKTGGLGRRDLKALLAGETLVREFKSGRKIALSVKG
jgi:hypothetical protein